MNGNAKDINTLREENIQLKEMLKKLTRFYILKRTEHELVLLQGTMGLRQAGDEIERQNEIIARLNQEKNEEQAKDELPDSTT